MSFISTSPQGWLFCVTLIFVNIGVFVYYNLMLIRGLHMYQIIEIHLFLLQCQDILVMLFSFKHFDIMFFRYESCTVCYLCKFGNLKLWRISLVYIIYEWIQIELSSLKHNRWTAPTQKIKIYLIFLFYVNISFDSKIIIFIFHMFQISILKSTNSECISVGSPNTITQLYFMSNYLYDSVLFFYMKKNN